MGQAGLEGKEAKRKCLREWRKQATKAREEIIEDERTGRIKECVERLQANRTVPSKVLQELKRMKGSKTPANQEC